MPSQGPNSAGSFSSDNSFGGSDWTSPANAAVSDDAYATADIGPTNTRYLKALDFGFSIPADATIDGIVVEWERKGSLNPGITDSRVRIVTPVGIGGNSGTDKASAADWPTSKAYASYGGSSDLWGETLNANDINSADFGAVLAAARTPSQTVSVDHVRITIYYTEAPNDYVLTAEPYYGFFVAGVSALLVLDRELVAVPGSYAVAGAAAGLLADRALPSAPGMFSLAGAAAELLADRTISAAPGSVAVAGVDAFIAPNFVAGSSGSFAITGAPAILLAERLIAADAGEFSAAGEAFVAPNWIAAATGTFAIAGPAADLGVSGSSRLRTSHGNFLANAQPFAGDGVSLYVTAGETALYRALKLLRGPWLRGIALSDTDDVFSLGETSVAKTARAASAAAPAGEIAYALPADLAGETITIDVRRYQDHVECETDNCRTITLDLDGGLAAVAEILGTATFLAAEERDGGIVRLRFRYFPHLEGIQPATFTALRTAGPTSPANASITWDGFSHVLEIDTPTLSDSAPYTYLIRAANGAITADILTGITVLADATGPAAPTGSAVAW